MPLYVCLLLGLLAAGGSPAVKGALGADAIVQPNGGILAPAGQSGSKKHACDAGSKDAAKFGVATVKHATKTGRHRTGRHANRNSSTHK